MVRATIHHYGHVKPPAWMGQKHARMAHWYRDADDDTRFKGLRFRQAYGLRRFEGSHPAVMRELVAAQDWTFEPRLDLRQWRLKDVKNLASDVIERATGHRFGERRKFRLLE